ncbi:MAG: deoxyguanosinetriphosphate triphosphohydrolase [Acidobacteria bacterium]|nr:deoxyguanosinetriphosphate triphosphohydrolase [Acidobacteriota bacterium]
MGLAVHAMEVARSAGRRHVEPAHPYRNDYQRDRDRILHSRAFRRLEAKTQVFTRRYSDHFRNRLTHTLETAQIARTVAAALNLNEDLCEALALVHDIGHPPFGHAGESKLDALMRRHGDRFDHNLQALRIVEQFEQRYAAFPGLNLTFEVREGIIKHSRDYRPENLPALGSYAADIAEYRLEEFPPLEAQLIDRADEVAYNTADLDDAFEARLLDTAALRKQVPLARELLDSAEKAHPQAPRKLQFNEALRGLINHLTTDLIEATRRLLEANRIDSVEAVRRHPKRLGDFSPDGARHCRELKQFLHRNLYAHPQILEERDRAVVVLEHLFEHYLAQPDRLPRQYFEQTKSLSVHRVACDYIAGMTDTYLLRVAADALGPAEPAPATKR